MIVKQIATKRDTKLINNKQTTKGTAKLINNKQITKRTIN